MATHILPETGMNEMPFADRVVAKRKERGYNQQQLADLIGLHVTQLRRYENGHSKPNLDVACKLAMSLQTSIDSLAFDDDERGPDEDLKMQFEAVCEFTPEEKEIARTVLEGLILRHASRKWGRVPHE